jgi:hypothetical protein
MITVPTQVNEKDNVRIHEKVIYIRKFKDRYVAEFKSSKYFNPIARIGVKPVLLSLHSFELIYKLINCTDRYKQARAFLLLSLRCDTKNNLVNFIFTNFLV